MGVRFPSDARGIHVSPGIYSKETELTYAVKSLGITTLGLVGETLRGPAFQPMSIENWREFQSTFGGTNPEKFLGSQYPKYELPYIAKSYLTQSNQLQVCRVLGLSGYNAGPAWAITANIMKGENIGKKMVVAVLRSRGYYEECRKNEGANGNECACASQVYDALTYRVGETMDDGLECNKPKTYNMNALALDEYVPIGYNGGTCSDYIITSDKENSNSFNVNALNNGRFKIKGVEGIQGKRFTVDERNPNYFEYSVSLNPNDKDFILNVLGSDPNNGNAPIFVESLYDVALKQLIENETITSINKDLIEYNVTFN